MGTLVAVFSKHHARNEALKLVPIDSTPRQKHMSKGHYYAPKMKNISLMAHRDLIGNEVKAIV